MFAFFPRNDDPQGLSVERNIIAIVAVSEAIPERVVYGFCGLPVGTIGQELSENFFSLAFPMLILGQGIAGARNEEGYGIVSSSFLPLNVQADIFNAQISITRLSARARPDTSKSLRYRYSSSLGYVSGRTLGMEPLPPPVRDQTAVYFLPAN